MKLHEGIGQDLNLVRHWAADGVVVGAQRLPLPCVVAPRHLHSTWAAAPRWSQFDEVLAVLWPLEPRIVLLGTGSRQQFAPAPLRRLFLERQVALECMDGAAACRTFNVLAQEERAAVLLALPDDFPD